MLTFVNSLIYGPRHVQFFLRILGISEVMNIFSTIYFTLNFIYFLLFSFIFIFFNPDLSKENSCESEANKILIISSC